jgi:hypothetical protein
VFGVGWVLMWTGTEQGEARQGKTRQGKAVIAGHRGDDGWGIGGGGMRSPEDIAVGTPRRLPGRGPWAMATELSGEASVGYMVWL